MENQSPEEPESRYYLVGMSLHGVEAIIDISEMTPEKTDHENVIRKLQGKDPVNDQFACLYSSLSLRVRFNGHRELQYWGLKADCLTADDLDAIAEEDEQVLIDLVKENGVCLIR